MQVRRADVFFLDLPCKCWGPEYTCGYPFNHDDDYTQKPGYSDSLVLHEFIISL